MRTHRTAVAAAMAAAALTLSACGGGSEGSSEAGATPTDASEFEAGSTMATLAEAGTIKIGTKFDQPGFGEKGLSGSPEGFDVKIGEYVAGKLGIEPDAITWVEAESAQREDLIANGDVDMIAATYTINDKRKERVGFAGPYYVAGQQIMVNKDNDAIKGPEDLAANPDQKICSVTGSTPAETIREYLAAPDQLVEFGGYDDCVTAMGTGQVAATTTDNVILLGYVSDEPDKFKLVGKQFTEEPYGIGYPKGDTAFCEFINEALTEASEDGSYEEAWTSTAGKAEGAETPELPTLEDCG